MWLVAFLLALYFLPTIVAVFRNHPNTIPILVINLFLGFTLLVWVIALAWAFSHIRDGGVGKMKEELREQREKLEKLQATYAEQKTKEGCEVETYWLFPA